MPRGAISCDLGLLRPLLLCLCVLFLTAAQIVQPPVVYSPVSVFIENQGLYILGGTRDITLPVLLGSTSFFMLDLSVSWNASSPVFKKLPDGPEVTSMPGSISADGQSFLALINGTAYIYNFKAATWSTLFDTGAISANSSPGLAGATDPETGIIYIPNGYNPNVNSAMLTINLTSKSYDQYPMVPDYSLNFTRLYSVAWCPPVRSMLMASGFSDGVFFFNPVTGWSHPTAKGTVPPYRRGGCLVPAYNGTKMIMFGGHSTLTASSLGDIYILDVPTLTWSKGPDAPSKRERPACAVSNDFFIMWGGAVSTPTVDSMPSSTPLIYNLKTNQWTSNYIYTQSPVPSASPNATISSPGVSQLPSTSPNSLGGSTSNGSTAKDEDSTSSSRIAVIIGSVIGVSFMAAGLVLFWVRSRRRHSQDQDITPLSDEPAHSPLSSSLATGRPHEGELGARRLSQHPHSDSELMELNFLLTTSTTALSLPGPQSLGSESPGPQAFSVQRPGPQEGEIKEYSARRRSLHPHAIIEPWQT